MILTGVKNWLIELIFPIRCAGCFKITSNKKKNRLICSDCLTQLKPSLYLHCPNCEARTVAGAPCLVCKDKTAIDNLATPLSYKEKTVQKIIKAYKYDFIRELSNPISKILLDYINIDNDFKNWHIVSVPLHKRRLNYRGYNQAELIAEQISKELDLEIIQGLARIKYKKPQAELEKQKRLENIKGVFKCLCPEKIKNRNIILVDDVYTTGATMNECARILKENGAKKVAGLAIARG